jgi:hypothetical protein
VQHPGFHLQHHKTKAKKKKESRKLEAMVLAFLWDKGPSEN